MFCPVTARLKVSRDTNLARTCNLQPGICKMSATLGEAPELLSRVVLPRTVLLSHHRGVFRLDFVDDADFTGLAVGIFIDAEIFLGHFVDVGAGAVFGDFDDATTNFEIAVGIFRVHEGQGDAGIAADVFIFLTSLGGVEDDMVTIKVAPDGGDLRATVGHEGGEVGEGALLKQVAIFFGDGCGSCGHRASLRVVR